MKKSKLYFFLCAFNFLFMLGILCFSVYNKIESKVAYVHNDRLFVEFDAFREGQAEYQATLKILQSNLDTLSGQYNRDAKRYSDKRSSLSKVDREKEEIKLRQQQQELIGFKNAIEKQAVEKEKLLNESIVKQINSLVEEYAKDNNYQAIIGVTENGNVLFAKKSEDITDRLITYMNKKYEGS